MNEKTRIPSVATAAVVAMAVLSTRAGDLNPPPGPVAPTNRATLNEQSIDLPYTISTAGSYVLTSDLTYAGPGANGVIVAADNVTLDLNGFAIIGIASAAGDGVVVSGVHPNIAITNGTVRGWPEDGVDVQTAPHVRIERLHLYDNGGDGLNCGDVPFIDNAVGGVIRDCTAQANGAGGLRIATDSSITGCTASYNGTFGIVANTGSTARDCVAYQNGTEGFSAGFVLGAGCTAVNCTARLNSGSGFEATDGTTLTGCAAAANGDNGFHVSDGCALQDCAANLNVFDGILGTGTGNLVRGCTAWGNLQDGIEVEGFSRVVGNICINNDAGIRTVGGSDNHVEGNTVVSNDTRGLWIQDSGNYIANNTVKGNTDNYDIADDNFVNILLSEIPETIDWPATVTLAGSLRTFFAGQTGITISSNDVTIDLGGHTLIGSPGSVDGILVSGARRGITIRNGVIRGWGDDGVDAVNSTSGQMENLRLYGNTAHGLRSGTNNTVLACSAEANGVDGIRLNAGNVARDCTALGNTDDGIAAAGGDTTITHCTARGNTGSGIATVSGCTVSECTSNGNTADGIGVTSDCRVVGNQCTGNGVAAGEGAGVHATGSDNRIEGNNVTDNDRGLDVDSSGNFIIRNSASGNTTNYSIAASNVGFYISASTTGAVSGSSGGTTIGTTDPWANLSF